MGRTSRFDWTKRAGTAHGDTGLPTTDNCKNIKTSEALSVLFVRHLKSYYDAILWGLRAWWWLRS